MADVHRNADEIVAHLPAVAPTHVSLVDEAALSIKYGHFTDNGQVNTEVTFVPGLRILRDAADL